MRGRNKYLSSVRSCLKVLSELPESRDIIVYEVGLMRVTINTEIYIKRSG